MPTRVAASIVLAQATVSTPGGYVSGSRTDLIVGQQLTATNLSDAGVVGHRWELFVQSWQDPADWTISGAEASTWHGTPTETANAVLKLTVYGVPIPGERANVAVAYAVIGIPNRDSDITAVMADGVMVPHPLEGNVADGIVVSDEDGRDASIAAALFTLFVLVLAGGGGGGGGSSAPTSILWDPDGVYSAAGIAVTATHVAAFADAIDTPLLVYCPLDNVASREVDTTVNLKGGAFLALPSQYRGKYTALPNDSGPGLPHIDVVDGGELQECALVGVFLSDNTTAGACWSNTELVYPAIGATIEPNNAPTIFAPEGLVTNIILRDGARLGTGTLVSCIEGDTSGGADPIIVLDIEGGAYVSGDAVSGGASAVLELFHDGSVIVGSETPVFAGTVIHSAKGTNGGSGSRADRPTSMLRSIPDGCIYTVTDADIDATFRFDSAANFWLLTSPSNPSIVDRVIAANVTRSAGTVKTATGFHLHRGIPIVGLRSWYNCSGSEDVKWELWRSGAALISETASEPSGTTIRAHYFSDEVDMASFKNVAVAASVFQVAGTHFMFGAFTGEIASAGLSYADSFRFLSPIWTPYKLDLHVTIDANPVGGGGMVALSMVEPIFGMAPE